MEFYVIGKPDPDRPGNLLEWDGFFDNRTDRKPKLFRYPPTHLLKKVIRRMDDLSIDIFIVRR